VADDAPRQPQVSLRRIVRLFVPYRVRLAGVLLLIVVTSLVGLASPFLLREMLDVALPQGRPVLLTWLAAGMMASAMAGAVISVLQSYWSLTIGQDIMNDLRNGVYAHLQRMSLAFFTRTRTGEVQSRIANDIGGMSATVTNVATTIAGSVTTVVATVVAMVALSWRLTIASLLMLPVFAWIGRKVGRERRAITLERQKQFAVMSAMVEESLSVGGFLLGRVMGRSDALTGEFAEQSSLLTRLTIRSSMAGRWRQSAIQIIMAAMPIVIYWTAGLGDRHGQHPVSVGTVVAFTTLQQRLLGPSVQVMQAGITMQSSLSLFERVFEYLDLPIDIAEPLRPVIPRRAGGHIRFECVDFSYQDQQVLWDIDLDLPPGRHLAVVGASGSGKTTLGYLVPRLFDVTAGRVTIDGVDVRDLSFATLADMVGVVSQDTHLIHATITENLRFAKPSATEEELITAARAAQVHDLVSGLPEGYHTVVGERGYRFSGGERQRLAIARTMLRNPPVLILDEATSALDTRTEQVVQQALDRLSDGRTTITIAHRLSTVRRADHIIVLDGGRIAEQGTYEHLLALNGRFSALVAQAEAGSPAPRGPDYCARRAK
jgi:ATP-binding cassette subfamily B protein